MSTMPGFFFRKLRKKMDQIKRPPLAFFFTLKGFQSFQSQTQQILLFLSCNIIKSSTN